MKLKWSEKWFSHWNSFCVVLLLEIQTRCGKSYPKMTTPLLCVAESFAWESPPTGNSHWPSKRVYYWTKKTFSLLLVVEIAGPIQRASFAPIVFATLSTNSIATRWARPLEEVIAIAATRRPGVRLPVVRSISVTPLHLPFYLIRQPGRKLHWIVSIGCTLFIWQTELYFDSNIIPYPAEPLSTWQIVAVSSSKQYLNTRRNFWDPTPIWTCPPT